MADSKIAIQKTLINEGGFTNNLDDAGGPTKYGITQKDVPNISIKDLTEEQAISYYSENFWKNFYSQIASQDLADKLFDMGVLFGVVTVVKLLQTVLQVSPVDGLFGEHTLQALNDADVPSALQAYKTILVSHAIGIANANPNDRGFLVGWIRRVNS